VITNIHLAAWNKLRNTGAHGGVLREDENSLQKHLNQFHTCLELFYRLLFVLVRYHGKFVKYSAVGWPESTFPEQETSA
jgi:hypothetical protein